MLYMVCGIWYASALSSNKYGIIWLYDHARIVMDHVASASGFLHLLGPLVTNGYLIFHELAVIMTIMGDYLGTC